MMARVLSVRCQELHDADYSIYSDVTCDCPASMDDDEHSRVCEPRPIFYLRSYDDPSVGIYGCKCSPTFSTMADAEAWIDAMPENEFAKYLGDDIPVCA
jgi:hypothetical protein